jgi:HEPN domain-containing protein/predicted nucleotidyltransferase
MIQRVNEPDSIALEAAARIADAIRPWRIVLFGSRARGTEKPYSDYDLYIEVDADENALRDIHLRITPLVDGKSSFDLKIEQRGTLERRRDDPGTIEWDVAREGHVLYADPSAPTSLAPAARVREQPRNPPESVAEWLESGDRDERHCRDLWQLGKDYWPEICWLSHQMCEKFMKALLVSRYVRPPRTHELNVLLHALRTDGADLGPLDADCALLTEHAIAPRYPTGLHLDENDARTAYAAAQRSVTAVRAKLASLDNA